MNAMMPADDMPGIPWAGMNAYSMLIPDPWEVAWTRLDAVFNGYAAPIVGAATQSFSPETQAILAALAGFLQISRQVSFTNPVPITANTASGTALLNQNLKRKLLVIQNNSTAVTTGDIAPTFYVGFGQQPSIGLSLALPPGVGIVLDISCPTDAIYVAQAGEVNTSGSVTVQGVVQEGA